MSKSYLKRIYLTECNGTKDNAAVDVDRDVVVTMHRDKRFWPKIVKMQMHNYSASSVF